MKTLAILLMTALLFPSCSKYKLINKCEKYDDWGIKKLKILGTDTSRKFVYTQGHYKIYASAEAFLKEGLPDMLTFCDSLTKTGNDKKTADYCNRYYSQKKHIADCLSKSREIDFNNFPYREISYLDSAGQFLRGSSAALDFGVALELCYVTIIDTRTNTKLEKAKLITIECMDGPTTIILKTVDDKTIVKYKYTNRF